MRNFGWHAIGTDGEEYGTNVAIFINEPPSYKEWLKGIEAYEESVTQTRAALISKGIYLGDISARLGPVVGHGR
jgi:hypothetical protein